MSLTVTPEQVRAACIEVTAFRSAGLEPDPLVVRPADATARDRSADDHEREGER